MLEPTKTRNRSYGSNIYNIKANGNPYQMQKKLWGFNELVRLGGPLNLTIFPKCQGILGKFWEIMGKYRMLHANPWGLKGI